MTHTHTTDRRPRHDHRVVAARLRLGAARPDGRPVGERDREVHFLALPDGTPTQLQLTTLCGQHLNREAVELIDTITGMPCALCLAHIPGPPAQRA
ncbi:hypothetical protein [Amycolatopsis australiensis]|uniref:Uncharacterized protein n=1 Tax=Amycolatopsis australiensis TaxID=546364 RepID=A0A1K1LKV4_9PSEU|nr:hypothetical protein [Amycolatopsis australiensis]SFW11516.1 hypothetical protein SAMN04489730_0027 [Amycolatopsis australiensis]